MLGNVQEVMTGKRRRFLGPVVGGYFRVPSELSYRAPYVTPLTLTPGLSM